MRPLVVTLDGPAGSGKSTVAHRLAVRLGLSFLDTGAMYRGLTAACLDRRIDVAGEAERVIDLARSCAMRFDFAADPPRLIIALAGSEIDVTGRLRDADVTRHVSDVAAMKEVRQVLVAQQQQIGREQKRLVTEGRDQGSIVFPDAQAKFYLDADPQVRARRRALQLRQAGRQADEQQILDAIRRRDKRDATRPDGPLICPDDATRIETSHMTLDEVVDEVERLVRKGAGAGGGVDE